MRSTAWAPSRPTDRAALPPVHERGEREARDDLGPVRQPVARRPLAAARLLGRHAIERPLARGLRSVPEDRQDRSQTVVTTGEDGPGVRHGHRRRLFLQTTKGAPNGRVVAATRRRPGARALARRRARAPGRGDRRRRRSARACIAVTYLKNASNVVEVFDITGGASRPGRLIGSIRQPGIGAAVDRRASSIAPRPFSRSRASTTRRRSSASIWRRRRPSPSSGSSRTCRSIRRSVEVEQVWYPSKDGTQISMFLVHKQGLREDRRRRRRCSTGYGGFNVSETPVFSATLFQWFEAGGLFALPNLRGGGEYGDAWHEAGHARQEAERLRRLHRRGRVADRARATRTRRSSRSPAARTAGCSPARRSRSGRICSAPRSSRCRCSTCCAIRTS